MSLGRRLFLAGSTLALVAFVFGVQASTWIFVHAGSDHGVTYFVPE